MLVLFLTKALSKWYSFRMSLLNYTFFSRGDIKITLQLNYQITLLFKSVLRNFKKRGYIWKQILGREELSADSTIIRVDHQSLLSRNFRNLSTLQTPQMGGIDISAMSITMFTQSLHKAFSAISHLLRKEPGKEASGSQCLSVFSCMENYSSKYYYNIVVATQFFRKSSVTRTVVCRGSGDWT